MELLPSLCWARSILESTCGQEASTGRGESSVEREKFCGERGVVNTLDVEREKFCGERGVVNTLDVPKMSCTMPSSFSQSREGQESGTPQNPIQGREKERQIREVGQEKEQGDDDVQKIGEKVTIREDDAEGLLEGGDGFRTPRGKNRDGTRTPHQNAKGTRQEKAKEMT